MQDLELAYIEDKEEDAEDGENEKPRSKVAAVINNPPAAQSAAGGPHGPPRPPPGRGGGPRGEDARDRGAIQ